MKKIALLTVLLIAGLMSGCFPTSIHPLYTEEDLVFEPALTGVWRGEDGETWNFTKADDKKFRLVYTDKESKAAQFEVHRVKLGDAVFLDFYPEDQPDRETNRSDVYQFHFVPVHSFAKVSETESALQ